MFDWLSDLFTSSNVNPNVDAAPAGWADGGADFVDTGFSPDYGGWLGNGVDFSGFTGTPRGYDAWDVGQGVDFSGFTGTPSGYNSWDLGQGVTYGPQTGGYNYMNSDFYGPPSDMAGGQGGSTLDSIVAMMDKAGKFMNSPGGKFAGAAGAGAISALDAMRRNKMLEKAMKKQEQMLAQRRAENMRYNEPLRLQMGRQAVAPQARQGESVWFKQNELPRAYAEGGYVMSDDELASLQQEAQQAQADARMDRPSALGFVKYMMAGKKMPSEIAAAKRARQQVATDPVSVIRTRQRALDEAAGYAEGGRYVRGGTAGQEDKVQALLSDGEYVMDADVVSALGDGNNEAGAARLDKMRENIRSHKRSAPAGKIPPKAKSPEAYLKKGK